jgi:CRP-like cAMP-binding protein
MTHAQAKDVEGNRWLGSLPSSDLARLQPHLMHCAFERGITLYDAGEDVDLVYFPIEGVVSLMTVLKGGVLVETAAIGREGLVGVTCGPMNGRAVSRAVAQTDGLAVCLKADRFTEALHASPAMRDALARYTEALFAQVQQTSACNALHKLEARMARWLLTLADRADGERSFRLTQEDLSDMLGVRRATVSEVGSILEGRGLIKRGRGRIEIVDRKGLEHAACECYGTIKETFKELLGEAA